LGKNYFQRYKHRSSSEILSLHPLLGRCAAVALRCCQDANANVIDEKLRFNTRNMRNMRNMRKLNEEKTQ
jgi:hypothetical protein